jgi:hypothetical protein
MTTFPKKLGLVSYNLSDSCSSDLNDIRLFN